MSKMLCDPVKEEKNTIYDTVRICILSNRTVYLNNIIKFHGHRLTFTEVRSLRDTQTDKQATCHLWILIKCKSQ